MEWRICLRVVSCALIVLFICIINAYAKSCIELNEIDTISKISIYCVQNINPFHCYYDNNEYTITNTKEIEFIVYMLNSFESEQTEMPNLTSDASCYIISVYYNDNTNCNIYLIPTVNGTTYIDCHEKTYGKMQTKELNEFLSFLYCMKTSDIISFDIMDESLCYATNTEIEKSINKGLFPVIHRFGCLKNISRFETCQLILNFIEKTNNIKLDDMLPMSNPFNDSLYLYGVKEAYALELVNGKSKNNFCPYDYLTREEFAKILSKAYHYVNKEADISETESIYADNNEISEWAKSYVNEMTVLGVLHGDDNGCFEPQGEITKEQVIVALLRLNMRCQGDGSRPLKKSEKY